MQPFRKAALSVAVVMLGATGALAQPIISAKSGVVSYVMGKVTVGDQAVQPSETKLTEIKENAVLRTEEGRAEVLLTLGTILRTGENGSFKMITNRLIDTRIELLSGSHVVEVAEISKDNNLTILAREATVVISKKGLYRFDVDQSQIKVYDGSLGVQINGQNVLVGAGKMVPMSSEGVVTASVEKFDREDTDSLDHWAKRRAERISMANASSAKQVHDAGCGPNPNSFASVNNPGTTSPCYNPCNSWRYNPWYGIVTYIPCGNNIYSPYGYRYWSPYNVMRAYYRPPTPVYNQNGGGYGAGNSGYAGVSQTSGGYSGVMSTPASSVASPSAGAMSGSTTSSSAGASSVGHGSAGGHGK